VTSLKCRKFTHEQLRKLITQIEQFGDHKLKGKNEKKIWYDELVQMFPPHTRTALVQKVNMLRMKMSESNKTRFGPWPVEEKAYTNRLIQVLPPTFPLHPPPPTHTHTHPKHNRLFWTGIHQRTSSFGSGDRLELFP